jgi:predicted TIM-barrel fold metal-dependent hydrolase
MAMSGRSAVELRAGLPHPVIDVDGHTVEFFPALLPELAKEGVRLDGPAMLRRLAGTFGPMTDWYSLTPEERMARRVGRGPWGGAGSRHEIDLASALLPPLLYERLDELGIDVSVIYPSYGLLFPHFDDEKDRRGACRALNRFNATLFDGLTDRLLPVASIPMHTPDEAIDELEHAVELGFTAVVMGSFVQRPIAAVEQLDADLAQYAVWSDFFGLDSPYDYDPLWVRCRELGISPSFHSSAMGWQNRQTPSSYVFNHIGMLGESNHSLAKALFLGGVTRRFPELNFGFLEGGVAWAASLFADLIAHWEKRNGAQMAALDPANTDWAEIGEYFRVYAPHWAADAPHSGGYRPEDVELLDEFAACAIEKAEDIYELFVPRFFSGCEADDPMTAIAYNTRVNPFGARINAMFGSDISHWDVPDMSDVVGEAWEMVEHELISADDFRDFVFEAPVRFYTHANPKFFAGTRVAAAVDAVLAADPPAADPAAGV